MQVMHRRAQQTQRHHALTTHMGVGQCLLASSWPTWLKTAAPGACHHAGVVHGYTRAGTPGWVRPRPPRGHAGRGWQWHNPPCSSNPTHSAAISATNIWPCHLICAPAGVTTVLQCCTSPLRLLLRGINLWPSASYVWYCCFPSTPGGCRGAHWQPPPAKVAFSLLLPTLPNLPWGSSPCCSLHNPTTPRAKIVATHNRCGGAAPSLCTAA